MTVARAGSVRAAAARLSVSHSTIVRRVSLLEAALQTRLFDRTPFGLRLTDAGEDLLPLAERLEGDMIAFFSQAEGRDEDVAGPVRLTMPDTLSAGPLTADLVAFQRAHPRVSLEVTSTYAFADLWRREADIALRVVSHGAALQDMLAGRRLTAIGVCAYASPSYLAAVADGRRSHSWIGWCADTRWTAATPFGDAPVVGRLDNVFMQLRAAEMDLGMAWVPCFLGDTATGLVRVGSETPQHDYDLWVLYHPDLRRNARLRAVKDHITQAVLSKRSLFLGRDAAPEPRRSGA